MIDSLCSYRYNSLILGRANNNPVQKAVSRLPCASVTKPVFVRNIYEYENFVLLQAHFRMICFCPKICFETEGQGNSEMV